MTAGRLVLGGGAVVVAAVSAALLLSDADDPSPPAVAAQRGGFVEPCGAPSKSLRFEAESDLRANGVTLHALAGGDGMVRGAFRRGRKDKRYPGYKVLTEVEPDVEVTISVPRGERRDLSLLYGVTVTRRDNRFRVSDGRYEVTFQRCAAAAEQSLFYRGGVVVRRPGCYSVLVRGAGKEAPVRLRFGMAVKRGTCSR